ncbi:MAG: DoxX family membrane protein [Deltaproteobacteria bacterium]|nr:DoxX family membrane protein [Deltaproteobacteria bacterium]
MACNGESACATKVSYGTSRIKPRVYHFLRLFMGAVWLYASYEKILYPHEFSQAVYNYQILPDIMVNLAALILPCLELLMGLCLITGIWLPGAAVLSTGLMSVFIAALVFNRIRGLDIHCGCFSVEATEGPADLWTVARDTGFMVFSAFLTWKILFSNRSKDH